MYTESWSNLSLTDSNDCPFFFHPCSLSFCILKPTLEYNRHCDPNGTIKICILKVSEHGREIVKETFTNIHGPFLMLLDNMKY